MEELNKIVEEPKFKLIKSSQYIDLNLDKSLNYDQNSVQPVLKQEIKYKNNKFPYAKKISFKNSNNTKNSDLLSKSVDELEGEVKIHKQKIISNEKKKIEESISKAPSACQSVLKVNIYKS
jgi:hypothetical protein